jgi:uncharacterized membrane protein
MHMLALLTMLWAIYLSSGNEQVKLPLLGRLHEKNVRVKRSGQRPT